MADVRKRVGTTLAMQSEKEKEGRTMNQKFDREDRAIISGVNFVHCLLYCQEQSIFSIDDFGMERGGIRNESRLTH